MANVLSFPDGSGINAAGQITRASSSPPAATKTSSGGGGGGVGNSSIVLTFPDGSGLTSGGQVVRSASAANNQAVSPNNQGFTQVKLDTKGTYGGYNPATGQVIAFADQNAFHQYFQNFDPKAQMAKFDTTAILNKPNQVLNLNQIKANEPMNIPSTYPAPAVPGQGDATDAFVAGIQAYQDNLADVTAPQTPEQKQQEQRRADLSKLYEQDTGKAAAEIRAEDALGVSQNRAALAEINGLILSRLAAFKAAYQLAENQAIPMSIIIGQQAQIKNKEAVEIGMLQAQALGLQGQINSAIDQAHRAVDLQYSAVEDQIRVLERQMELAKPMLSAQEERQRAALQLGLDQKKEALAEYKDKVKSNLSTLLSNQVKTPFANMNGEFMKKDGTPYTKPADFFRDAGVSSFEEAYNRGLVTDVASPIPKQDTQVIEVNNRKILINAQTGATIKDLGYSGPSGGGSSGSVTLTTTDKQALLAAGFTASEITKIVNDVNAHGIEKTVTGLPAVQADAIRKVLGGVQPSKLTRQNISALYGIPDNSERSKFVGIAHGDTNSEKLDALMSLIKRYQDIGTSDEDILKIIQEQ